MTITPEAIHKYQTIAVQFGSDGGPWRCEIRKYAAASSSTSHAASISYKSSHQLEARSVNYQVTRSMPALLAIVRVDVNQTYRLL